MRFDVVEPSSFAYCAALCVCVCVCVCVCYSFIGVVVADSGQQDNRVRKRPREERATLLGNR